jgi:MSHA pilin protein MshA
LTIKGSGTRANSPVFRREGNMKKQAGFTLIELVAVLVILALLGAMAVPRFVDVSNDALTAAKNGSIAAVRTGHAMAIADLKQVPTLTQLLTYVGGQAVALPGGNNGIEVTINGTAYVVRTYTDTTCGTATSAATDPVRCVGDI